MSTDQYELQQPNTHLIQDPFVRKILTIMRYIAYELDTPHSGDDLLFSILHFPFYNIPAEEIAKVSRRVAEKGYKDKTSLRQYLKEWHQTHGLTMFTPPAEQAMMELSPVLERWLREAPQLSLQQLSDIITSDYPEKELFSNFLAEEILRDPNLTLTSFVNKIPSGHSGISLAPEIPAMDPLFVNPLLSGFMMNVTALNNYLDCPLSFFYKSLIRAPYGRSESMEFGSAVHYAVEKLFQKMQDNEQKHLSFYRRIH